ncbi:TIGR03619 family F420-dependent LLM class oxidoreductase [Phytoactinopolyspora halotolerans]|uniref:TIGR03619 family F420-dependent LLM class oxidoreductase n=1 Tax=Phytoactinopolyspora halotolerans TaxID=1981512 RepID=A0A6L9SG78_9ACTN|nr:TIGR03619 family F420-dependent LLM class oxidoreductase [Phytoactinopolyspora halotolerans]NEE04077.1 TIGR03619 family F420-dependent LLM class oxidoreductase [Phytoactinopolyspora halotolerans]
MAQDIRDPAQGRSSTDSRQPEERAAAHPPRLHAVLPNESVDIGPERIVELARHAEDLGYEAVWLPDHLLPPGPYGRTYGGVYEPLVMLAAVAASTRRVRFGTSVLILPLRDPFLLAKQVSTVERLAPGRMILGVGTGWDAAEFAALGAEFRGRGARADEALRLIRHLHAVGKGPFDGPTYGFEIGVFAPQPTAPVPIMVGGTSDVALRRAAAYADVWQGVGLDVAGFRARVAALRTRTDRPIDVGTRISMDGRTRPEDAASEIAELGEAGAGHVAVSFGPAEGCAERMTALKRQWR